MAVEQQRPEPPRPLWWTFICVSVLALGTVGAVGGYTGMVRSEYKASPGFQAIVCGIMGGMVGLYVGLVGGLIDGVRWLGRQGQR